MLVLVHQQEVVRGQAREVWDKIHYLMILKKVLVIKQGNLVGEMKAPQAMVARAWWQEMLWDGLVEILQVVGVMVEVDFLMIQMDHRVEEGFLVEDQVFREDFMAVHRVAEAFLEVFLAVYLEVEAFLAVHREEEVFREVHLEVGRLVNRLVIFQHGLVG